MPVKVIVVVVYSITKMVAGMQLVLSVMRSVVGDKHSLDTRCRAGRAAGGRRLYAETSGRAQYRPTRRFYRRAGFRREARLRDFYAPGDDKLIFVKELSPPSPP